MTRAAGKTLVARAARRAAGAALALGVFVLALGAGVWLHLDLPLVRQAVERFANGLLPRAIEGSMLIHGVEELRPNRARLVRVKVLDPAGDQVLIGEGLTIRLRPWVLLESLLRRDRPLQLVFPEVRADRVEAMLRPDAAGTPTLGAAFRAADSDLRRDGEARSLDVVVEKAVVTEALLQSRSRPVSGVDARLEDVVASGHAEARPDVIGVRARAEHARVLVRHLASGRTLRGELLAGSVDVWAPQAEPAAVFAEGRFSGQLGAVPVSLTGRVQDDRYSVTVIVRETAADAIRALAPGLPVHEPVGGRFRISGDAREARVRGFLSIGAGVLGIRAAIEIRPTTRVRANVAFESVDPRAFAPAAPSTRIDGALEADVRILPGGRISANVVVRSQPFALAGYALPAMVLSGRWTDGLLTGQGLLQEPGLPVGVAFRLELDGPDASSVLELTAEAAAPDLREVERFAGRAGGAGDAELRSRIVLEERHLELQVAARGRNLMVNGVGAASALFETRVSGRFDELAAETELVVRDATVPALPFTDMRVRARGPLLNPRASALFTGPSAPRVALAAELDLARPIEARRLRIGALREDVVVVGRAGLLRAGDGEMVIQDALLSGIGTLEGSARLVRGGGELRAEGRDVDLRALGVLLGKRSMLRGGRGAFDVDVAVRDLDVEGYIQVAARDLHVGMVRGGSLYADVRADERRVGGAIRVDAGSPGAVQIAAGDLHLEEPLLHPSSLLRAWGDVRLASSANVEWLSRLLPDLPEPLRSASGALAVEAHLSRGTPDEAPDVHLAASATDVRLPALPRLAAASPRVPVSPVIAPRVDTSATAGTLSARASLQLAGASGLVEGRLDVMDGLGKLVALSLRTELPVQEWMARERISWRPLQHRPLRARLELPWRPTTQLPAGIQLPIPSGEATATLTASGTFADPSLALDAAIAGIHVPEMAPATALDIEARARYSGGRGGVWIEASADGRPVLDGESRIVLKMPSPFAAPLDWRASARVRLQELPLGLFAPLQEHRIGGRVSGELSVDGLGREARASGALVVEDARVGAARVDQARARVLAGAGRLQASLVLEQPLGHGRADLQGGIVWKRNLVPRWSSAVPLSLRIAASDFQASTLLPLAGGGLTDLQGRLDADLRVQIDRESGSIDGTLGMREGLLQVPLIGQELRDVSLDVSAENGRVRLERGFARAATGRITFDGAALFDGVRFHSARATIRVPRRDSVPVTFRGVSFGRAWGNVDLQANMAKDRQAIQMRVRVPTLSIELPKSLGRDVQSLDDAAYVRIGARGPSDEFVPLLLGPPEKPPRSPLRPIYITLHFDDLRLERGAELSLTLRGNTSARIAEDFQMLGQVHLADGWLEIVDRRFSIEHGTATFEGDAGNPVLVATGRWESPEGIAVFADFVGPLQTGTLSLRSSPPLTESEIVSLLLFGTPEGAIGSAYAPAHVGAAAAGAVGVGVGLATRGLGRALSEIAPVEVTARVRTEPLHGPRPEVVVQVTRRLSVGLAHVLGEPTIGRSPDRSLITLILRLPRRWSLETTFGDAGSSIFDATWRRRY